MADIANGTSTQRRYCEPRRCGCSTAATSAQAALSDAPSIVGVDAKPDVGGVAFTAQVVGDPAAGIQQVWVTYTGDGAPGVDVARPRVNA